MSRTIFCKKLQKEASGFDTPPYPGELGKKVYEHISQEAWSGWIGHQTMLINEYRLNLLDAESRQFLETEMDKYLFGEGSEKPKGYVETK